MSSRPPSGLDRRPSQRPPRGSRRARSLSLPTPGPGPRPDLDPGRPRRSRRTGQLDNWPDSERVGADEAGIEGALPPQSPTRPNPRPPARLLRPPLPSQPVRPRRAQSQRNPPRPWMGADPRGIPMHPIPRHPQRRGPGFTPGGAGLPPRPNFPGPMQPPYGGNPSPFLTGFGPPPRPSFRGPYGGGVGAGGGGRGVGPVPGLPGPGPGRGPGEIFYTPAPLRRPDPCCHIL